MAWAFCYRKRIWPGPLLQHLPLDKSRTLAVKLLPIVRHGDPSPEDAGGMALSLVTTSWPDFLCPSENQCSKTLPAHPVRTVLQAVCHPEKALEPKKLVPASQTWLLSLLCHHCPGRNNPLMQSGPVHAWGPPHASVTLREGEAAGAELS